MLPWQQKNNFSLVVNNLCVKYCLTEYANHFKNPSEPNTSSQSTWQRQSTSGLRYNGTVCTEPSHSQFQVMYARLCTYSSTLWDVSRSTHPIHVTQSNMDRRSNMHTLWMHQSISQINKLTSFNKCVVLSYIIPSLLITLFSLSSATFPHSNLRPQRKQKNRWPISWTTSLIIHTRKYSTGQVGYN